MPSQAGAIFRRVQLGTTEKLARFAIETPTGFLTPALAQSVREKFLDTIGIMVAGVDSPSTAIVLRTALEAGGAPEASIIGTPYRSSLANAGFVNGVSAHALEYDDNTPDVGHVSACMVPGCLAIAERLKLSGLQLMEAFALGYEVAGRISLGLKPAMFDRGWHSPGMIGGLGVTVAASRLMGMDAMGTRMAIGLMASSGTGVRKNVGSAGKAFHIGNGVRAGLTAASLAHNGFEVDPDIIEGAQNGAGHQRFGLAETFSGAGGYSLERMEENLGHEFVLTRIPTMVRMHPGSTVTGAAIDGIIELTTLHDIGPDDIEEMHVECHPRMLVIASYSEPSDGYRAKFCPPYTFAVALMDRRVGLAQYSAERIRDPRVLALMKRVRITVRTDLKEVHGEWGSGDNSWGAVKLALRLKNGQTISGNYTHAKGWPGNPASWDDLCGKYEDCVQNRLSSAQLRESLSMLANLDKLPSVSDLLDQLRTA